LDLAVQEFYPSNILEIKCQELGLDSSAISLILQAWEEKKSSIAAMLLSKTTSNCKLVDMEWSFGVTAASDDCDNVGKTYLQLKLVLQYPGSLERKHVFMELTLDQFYQFLASMEKCKTLMDLVNPV